MQADTLIESERVEVGVVLMVGQVGLTTVLVQVLVEVVEAELVNVPVVTCW